jgi:hypothetical protein
MEQSLSLEFCFCFCFYYYYYFFLFLLNICIRVHEKLEFKLIIVLRFGAYKLWLDYEYVAWIEDMLMAFRIVCQILPTKIIKQDWVRLFCKGRLGEDDVNNHTFYAKKYDSLGIQSLMNYDSNHKMEYFSKIV